MRIMLITDGSLGRDPTLLKKLEIACRSGLDAIQLREKEASTWDLFHFAKKLRGMTAKWGVSLFINERFDVALAVNADGVHLPESSPFPRTSLRVGRSVHSLQAALSAQKEGADYLLFGPIFPPLSKPCNRPIQGLIKLKELSDHVQIPIVAVGGVTSKHISCLLKSGASGVASISSLLHAPDIAETIASFQTHFSLRKQKIKGLYAVISSLSIAIAAIRGGVDVIQFRHKGPYTTTQVDIVREIRLLCRNANVPFIINDRCDIALEVDADGVHLGQSDLPISVVRRILGTNKIIGGSASTIAQAVTLESLGADYVGFGHIFPTASKHKNYPPIGLDMIQKAKEKLQIPLIAIGGISEENAQSVLAKGADGVAIISAISQASNPCEATQRFKRYFYDGSICPANVFARNGK